MIKVKNIVDFNNKELVYSASNVLTLEIISEQRTKDTYKIFIILSIFGKRIFSASFRPETKDEIVFTTYNFFTGRNK